MPNIGVLSIITLLFNGSIKFKYKDVQKNYKGVEYSENNDYTVSPNQIDYSFDYIITEIHFHFISITFEMLHFVSFK